MKRTRATAKPPNGQRAAPAKITPPRLPGVYARSRLFLELDRARAHPVVWVVAPAGYGKTTLVASYLAARALPTLWYQLDEGDADIATYFHYLGLAARRAAPRARWSLPHFTPEYFASLPVFARRTFEQLAAHLPAHTVVVLDNYQDVPLDAALHEVVHNGFSQIPEGMTVIVLSRHEPPAAYATDRANNTVVLIEQESLRLTEAESIEICRARRPGVTQGFRDAAVRLHQRAEGWPAGLVLLMAQGNAEGLTSLPPDASPDVLFEYFYREVFDKTDQETQQLLLRTAFLPIVSPAAAEELTQNARAEGILAGLHRNNFFTLMRSSPSKVYQYHPLLRDFLIAQTQRLPLQWRSELLAHSALLLQREGRVEDAAQVLYTAGDWPALAALIKQQASAFLERGSHHTVAAWLERLPREALESDPWLLFWLGACRLAFDPSEARQLFTRAYADFRASSDCVGAFLAWASTVEAIGFEWDDRSQLELWISDLDDLLELYPAFPSPQIEARVTSSALVALMFGRPSHPEIGHWCERLQVIVEQTDDPNERVLLGVHLVIYRLIWLGELASGEAALDQLRPPRGTKLSVIAEIFWQTCVATWCWLTDRHAEGVAAVAVALRAADEHGVVLCNFIVNAAGVDLHLAQGDLSGAAPYLSRLEQLLTPRRRVDRAHYLFLQGWVAGLRGHYGQAVVIVQQCFDRTGGISRAYISGAHTEIALAQLCQKAGQSREALGHAARASEFGKSMRSPLLQYEAARHQAWISFELGNEAEGLEHLREAFAIGRNKGYARLTFYFNDQTIFAKLCARALEAKVEVDYAKALIRVRGLLPPPSEPVPESWPLPIKIYTLGRFALLRDGKAVTFASKTQKRPLQLLKALIAMGGRDVREDSLAEALWPEADADSAAHSLTSTVHRLRTLVGVDAVQRQSGRISLDARHCWVDAWSFERELSALEKVHCVASSDEIATLTERLVGRYRGAFLETDLEEPWLLAARDRLQGRILRLLEALGRGHVEASRFEDAAASFRKAIEIEPLSEACYRGLMRASLLQGRYAEVVSTYHRCQRALRVGLGCPPSAETEALLVQASMHRRIDARGGV